MKNEKYTHSFKENIWGADLADMELISKFNKEICFILCLINIYSKYARVVPLKGLLKLFKKILGESNGQVDKSEGCKPNKIEADEGSEFYNRSMKSWLLDNDTEMYSTHNEGKYVVAEIFIRTLKNKIYKYNFNIKECVY